MAQRKQLTWAELRVGVFVLGGLIILMVAIFYVTGASFLGPKYKLITYLPEVDGLNTGAPVALDGVEIGIVQSITLTPHPTSRDQSITLVLRIDSKYQRPDSPRPLRSREKLDSQPGDAGTSRRPLRQHHARAFRERDPRRTAWSPARKRRP